MSNILFGPSSTYIVGAGGGHSLCGAVLNVHRANK